MKQNLENERSYFIPEKALKKQLTDKERIHREEQSIKIDEKDFDLIPVSVCLRLFFEKKSGKFFSEPIDMARRSEKIW